MSFDVTPDSYTRFMGQYSLPLATKFADLADLRPGLLVLDVGCGPGVLTAELVERLGAEAVAAIDPSPPFVAATRELFPDADVRQGTAEALPFEDASFDRTLAQLVVHFMSDPVAGLREMRRVTRPGGGLVAACVWDHAGGGSPLATFWTAVHRLDPDAHDEADLAGAREGHLAELFGEAGMAEVESGRLTVRRWFAGFEDWWEPYLLGVGPAGAYVTKLDDARRRRLAEQCRELLPEPPFEVDASAWYAVARV